jgi:hypothetical protein
MKPPGATGAVISSAERALKRQLPRTLTRVRPSADWRWALVETVVVMAVAIACSALVRPEDPLWTASPFPWLWLVAAILALRYGSAHAVIAMGVALAGWLLLDAYLAPLGDFPRVSFLGGLVLALIAGEFSDVWNARLNQGQSVNAYLDERLRALTQSHFLLTISHDRLEQELLARPFTLRETLFTVRQLTRQSQRSAETPLPAGDWVLQLLAQASRLEAAALFALRDGRLDLQPVALVGKFGAGEGGAGSALDLDDPMLTAALESGELMHVQSEPFVDTDRPSRYVVCAPVVASGGQILGVVAVERMAFTALTLETLQFLTVLLAYYADSLEHGDGVREIRAVFERCPDEFAVELVRLQRLLVTAFVRSSLVAFTLPADAREADEWVTRFERLRRSIDLAWLNVAGGRRELLLLLPLTYAQGVDGYIDRIQRTVREQYGIDLGSAGIVARSVELDEREPAAQLQAFVARADA